MINNIEAVLKAKQEAGITTYTCNVAEVERFVQVARRAEALLRARPHETALCRIALDIALREIGIGEFVESFR